MATTKAQRKWRDKHRLVKSQLNVMARKATHESLEDFARSFALKGKGEAVTFACFFARALIQRAGHNAEAARMVDDFAQAYIRDRDMHAACERTRWAASRRGRGWGLPRGDDFPAA